MAKTEYHTDKWAIENVNPRGDVIRFMEIFGENGAKSTFGQVKSYQESKGDGSTSRLVQIAW